MDEERIFTLTEAQSLLPTVRRLVEEISQEWERIREMAYEKRGG